jgi:hypothetical protein
VPADDVVDQLGDQHRLADPAAAEQAGLAAPLQRGREIDGLDPGDEDLGRGALLGQRHRRPAERPPLTPAEIAPAADGSSPDGCSRT